MLAATSIDRDQSPAPLHVALRILSSERRLPEKLSTYVRDVFRQALQIMAHPESINAQTLPEAIQLAVDLKESAELRDALDSVGNGTISAKTAQDILAAERRFAAPR
jgi:hypothetical protein